jgi:hypothetical protein
MQPVEVFEHVIASAATQSMPVRKARWIASSQALLAMTGKQLNSMADISSQALRNFAERGVSKDEAGVGTGAS